MGYRGLIQNLLARGCITFPYSALRKGQDCSANSWKDRNDA